MGPLCHVRKNCLFWTRVSTPCLISKLAAAFQETTLRPHSGGNLLLLIVDVDVDDELRTMWHALSNREQEEIF
ncbi:hypothetical protein Tco_1554020 [Tanacetum coccineum]